MRILVVDDEQPLRHTISMILSEEGHEVTTATDGEDALAKLATSPADLILCDVRMPTMDGMTFLERHAAAGGAGLVVMMSAYGDAETAIAAMQRGAYDWIQKPFRAEEIVLVVRKAMEREGLRAEVKRLERELSSLRQSEGAIIGGSAVMRASLDLARGQELDILLRRVGRLPEPEVPSYTGLDVRYALALHPALDLSVTLQNLLDRQHPEFGAAATRSEIERGVFVRLQWQP